MSHFSRNSLIVAVLLVISIAIILKIQADSAQLRVDLVDLEIIPYKIGSWKGIDIPKSQKVYEILETDNIVLREYRDAFNYPVLVAIVFSESKRDSFYPPETCYTKGGFDLVEKKFDKLVLDGSSTLNTTKLVVRSDADFITSWHWFIVGNRKIASYYGQQFAMLQSFFSSQSVKSAMVCISVNGNNELGEEKASKFVDVLMPHLTQIMH